MKRLRRFDLPPADLDHAMIRVGDSTKRRNRFTLSSKVNKIQPLSIWILEPWITYSLQQSDCYVLSNGQKAYSFLIHTGIHPLPPPHPDYLIITTRGQSFHSHCLYCRVRMKMRLKISRDPGCWLRRPPFNIRRGGGGGGGVFVAGKLLISTGLGGALEFHILLHVYIEQFWK